MGQPTGHVKNPHSKQCPDMTTKELNRELQRVCRFRFSNEPRRVPEAPPHEEKPAQQIAGRVTCSTQEKPFRHRSD